MTAERGEAGGAIPRTITSTNVRYRLLNQVDVDKHTGLCMQAEEIAARATADVALTTVDNAIDEFDAGLITVQDVLARIAYAGSQAERAMGRGWEFLYQRKGSI